MIELAIHTVAPAPAGASADVAHTKTPRKHILVLDDDSAFVELLRALFVDDGYIVSSSRLESRTYAMIGAVAPNLLLVDLSPSNPLCWDVLMSLRQEVVTRSIPLLLTSTDPQMLARAQSNARLYGQHAVIAKPMDIDVLHSSVKQLVTAVEREDRQPDVVQTCRPTVAEVPRRA